MASRLTDLCLLSVTAALQLMKTCLLPTKLNLAMIVIYIHQNFVYTHLRCGELFEPFLWRSAVYPCLISHVVFLIRHASGRRPMGLSTGVGRVAQWLIVALKLKLLLLSYINVLYRGHGL